MLFIQCKSWKIEKGSGKSYRKGRTQPLQTWYHSSCVACTGHAQDLARPKLKVDHGVSHGALLFITE